MKTLSHVLVCLGVIWLAAEQALAAEFVFIPRLSVTEEYTDNLFLSDEEEEEEFITSVIPGVTLGLVGKTNGVSVAYDPAYRVYDEFDEYDAWNHEARLQGWIEFSRRTRLTVGNSFRYAVEPATEERAGIRFDLTAPDLLPGEAIPGGEPVTDRTDLFEVDGTTFRRRSDDPFWVNSATLDLTHQFGANDTISLAYLYRILENDDEFEEDSERHSPGVTLVYWMVPNRWGVETRAVYTRGEFSDGLDIVDGRIVPEDNDDFDNWYGSLQLNRVFSRHLTGNVRYEHTYMDFDTDRNDYQVYNPSVGLDYQWTEDTRLAVNVGYFIEDEDGSDDDEDGLTVDGEITRGWRFKRGAFFLTGATGYDQSFFDAENRGFEVYYQVGGRGEYGFTRRITGDIYASYRLDDYVNVEPDREEDNVHFGAGLTIEPARWLAVRLGYAFRMVDSDEDEDDFEENRVFLGITLIPFQPKVSIPGVPTRPDFGRGGVDVL